MDIIIIMQILIKIIIQNHHISGGLSADGVYGWMEFRNINGRPSALIDSTNDPTKATVIGEEEEHKHSLDGGAGGTCAAVVFSGNPTPASASTDNPTTAGNNKIVVAGTYPTGDNIWVYDEINDNWENINKTHHLNVIFVVHYLVLLKHIKMMKI
eukprot:146330_1